MASLKLLMNDKQMEEDPYGLAVADRINEVLGNEKLVVHGVKKIARSFCARNRGILRNYQYLIPQSVFMDSVKKGTWVTHANTLAEGIDYCNKVLQTFVGQHNFHNFGNARKKRKKIPADVPLPSTATPPLPPLMKEDPEEEHYTPHNEAQEEEESRLNSSPEEDQTLEGKGEGEEEEAEDEEEEDEGDEGESDQETEEEAEEGEEEEEMRWSPTEHSFLLNREEQRATFVPDMQLVRHITQFSCEPLEIPGYGDFILFNVQGKSFVTHQIRKMVDAAVSTVGGLIPMPALTMALNGPYKFGELEYS